jgi:hypothetical protein
MVRVVVMLALPLVPALARDKGQWKSAPTSAR